MLFLLQADLRIRVRREHQAEVDLIVLHRGPLPLAVDLLHRQALAVDRLQVVGDLARQLGSELR